MSRLFGKVIGDHLDLGTAVVTAAPFTIAGWIWPTAVAANNVLELHTNGSGNNFYLLTIGALGVVIGLVRTTSNASAQTTATCTASAWNHVAYVEASTTSRSVYLAGGNKVTNTTSKAPSAPNRTIVGGDSASIGTAYFDGRIAELGIWNAALTDAEIAALATGVHPMKVRTSSLKAYWPIYGVATTEPDLSGNVNNVTVNGTTVKDHAPVPPLSGMLLRGR